MKRFISYTMNLSFRFAFVRQLLWGIFVCAVFSIAAALVFQNRRVSTNPVGWEKSFQVSSFNVVAKDVAVASRGDMIIAVYEGNAGGNRGIYVSQSFNGGRAFMQSTRVAAAVSQTSMNPHAAISPDGRVTVMWHQYVDRESTSRIFYTTSMDMGATWSQPKQLALEKEMEMLPRIYYDDRSHLHLFYHGSVGENISLYHALSEDGGTFRTTGSLVRLTASMRGAFFPSIHISGKYFFMVWQGKEEDFSDELFFIKSSDYGGTWSIRKQITSSVGNNASPVVLLHENTLYVAYRNNDEKNWAIKLIRGLDRGWAWESVPLTVSSTMANCYYPAIGATGSDITVLWYDTREGGARIFARKYSITEKTFMPEAELSDARYGSRNPWVVPLGKRLLVFWEERNTVMAKQTDVYVEPPVVFSPTNPEGKWSRTPYVQMEWDQPRDESGIAGYAAIWNTIPDFNPSVVNMKPNITMETISENITDGVSYFHIRAVDGAGNFSRTIHYRLLMAVNPLPGPVIVSPTNPQGKPSKTAETVFNWSIDEPERVKGFLVSLSKDSIKMPEKFTTDLKTAFTGLEDGTYFFCVAAVDKTNQVSRVSTYDFIIGPPDRVVDPEYYRRIAEAEKKFQKEYRSVRPPEDAAVAVVPMVAIRFPFDTRKAYDRSSFRAHIVARNIRPQSVLEYSLSVDSRKGTLSGGVTRKGNVIDVQDLADGDYYFRVRCKYSEVVNGTVMERWTRPYVAKISIMLPAVERSPVMQYAQRVMEKFPRRFGLVTLTFAGLGLVITTLGYGSRISFYVQLVLFRLGLLFRRGVKKMSG